MSRTCPRCETEKDLSLFSRNASSSSGVQTYCRACQSAAAKAKRSRDPDATRRREAEIRAANKDRIAGYQKAYRERHPDRAFDSKFVHKYRLTKADIDAMSVAQGNRCAICSTSFSDVTRCVDHDQACCPGRRSCGKCVRALLCQKCNRGLGTFNDNPATLSVAADYLTKWSHAWMPSSWAATSR